MRYLKIIAFFVLCSLFISFSVLTAKAADKNDEINDLKQKVTELENRIKDLESLLKFSRKPVDKKAENRQGWWNKKSWRSLKEGMSQKQVEEILGEPVKAIKGIRTIWYYPNFYRGNVSFDEEGNLTGWIEP